MASAEFYRRFVVACRGEADTDHPEVTLVSSPSIPNRLQYLTDPAAYPDPVPRLVDVAERLVADGCTILALPSVTTHALVSRVQEALSTPIVNMLDAVAEWLAEAGCSRVAILMTSPARASGLLADRLAAAGVETHLPSGALQARIQGVVDSVKAGHDLAAVEAELRCIVVAFEAEVPAGARPLIGCTDISPAAARLDVLDVSQIYAQAVALRLRR